MTSENRTWKERVLSLYPFPVATLGLAVAAVKLKQVAVTPLYRLYRRIRYLRCEECGERKHPREFPNRLTIDTADGGVPPQFCEECWERGKETIETVPAEELFDR